MKQRLDALQKRIERDFGGGFDYKENEDGK